MLRSVEQMTVRSRHSVAEAKEASHPSRSFHQGNIKIAFRFINRFQGGANHRGRTNGVLRRASHEVEKDIVPCLFLLAIPPHPFVLEAEGSPLIRARGG